MRYLHCTVGYLLYAGTEKCVCQRKGITSNPCFPRWCGQNAFKIFAYVSQILFEFEYPVKKLWKISESMVMNDVWRILECSSRFVPQVRVLIKRKWRIWVNFMDTPMRRTSVITSTSDVRINLVLMNGKFNDWSQVRGVPYRIHWLSVIAHAHMTCYDNTHQVYMKSCAQADPYLPFLLVTVCGGWFIYLSVYCHAMVETCERNEVLTTNRPVQANEITLQQGHATQTKARK